MVKINDKEIALMIFFGLITFALSIIFLPTLFSIAVVAGLFWFFLARSNGYRSLSYGALAVGITLLFLIYPFYSSSDLKTDAGLLAVKSGAVSSKGLLAQGLSNDGNNTIFLVRNKGKDQVALVRPLTSSTEIYSISNINQQTEQKKYNPSDVSSKQNEFMISNFQEKYPLMHGASFVLFLIPLFLVAALPRRRFKDQEKVFNSKDGKLFSWFFPDRPSEDLKGSPGSAVIVMMLILSLFMACAFLLSAPGLSYIF